MTEPLAYRPLYLEYITVGHILRHERSVYDMTEEQFVNCCMFYSHGAMSPFNARIIYNQLMKEAGLDDRQSV